MPNKSKSTLFKQKAQSLQNCAEETIDILISISILAKKLAKTQIRYSLFLNTNHNKISSGLSFSDSIKAKQSDLLAAEKTGCNPPIFFKIKMRHQNYLKSLKLHQSNHPP